MVGSRTSTALIGLIASLAISLALWWYLGTVVFFLFVPFVPILFRRTAGRSEPNVRTCPRCGFRTRDAEFEYCPRDGRRLEPDLDSR